MNKHELYERILKLVEQSNIKEENGSYIIKLTNNKELFPYSNKIFMVEIDIGENEWIGGLWITQTIFRQSDKGLWNLVSHADGGIDGEAPIIDKHMAAEVLASYLYYILKKGKKNEK